MELIRKVISTYVKLTMKYIHVYRTKYRADLSLSIRDTVPSNTSLLENSTFKQRPSDKGPFN